MGHWGHLDARPGINVASGNSLTPVCQRGAAELVGGGTPVVVRLGFSLGGAGDCFGWTADADTQQ